MSKNKKKDTSKGKKNILLKLWDYIWKSDSLGSYILNFLLAFVLIKYIFFPGIGFLLDTNYPIVAVVSGSMEHKIVNGQICSVQFQDSRNQNLDYDSWWEYCGSYYQSNYGLSKENFSNFKYSNGLNIGDVMILRGKDPSNIKPGEILVFIPEQREFYLNKGPVIHRVMKVEKNETGGYIFQTKGDHNPMSFEGFEREIPEEDILGVAEVRIPYLGYPKILLNYLISRL